MSRQSIVADSRDHRACHPLLMRAKRAFNRGDWKRMLLSLGKCRTCSASCGSVHKPFEFSSRGGWRTTAVPSSRLDLKPRRGGFSPKLFALANAISPFIVELFAKLLLAGSQLILTCFRCGLPCFEVANCVGEDLLMRRLRELPLLPERFISLALGIGQPGFCLADI